MCDNWLLQKCKIDMCVCVCVCVSLSFNRHNVILLVGKFGELTWLLTWIIMKEVGINLEEMFL